MGEDSGAPGWDDGLYEFEGLYPLGSEMDRAMLEAWRRVQEGWEQLDSSAFQISVRDPLIDHGIVKRPGKSGVAKWAVPGPEVNLETAFLLFDRPFLCEFDRKIRWCRRFLQAGAQHSGDGFLSAQWYAEKCLKHVERMIRLINEADRLGGGLSDYALFGLMRELVSFGETWAEARFAVNNGRIAVTGAKVNRGARLGHEMVHGNAAAKASRRAVYVAEVDALIAQGTPKTAAYSLVAERHGVSEKTIRRHLAS